MDLLFLSHCVPNPPDKGEKIRAYYIIRRLAEDYRVHLACFGRGAADLAHARELSTRCASVHVELVSKLALPRSALSFAFGGCLNTAFYKSAALRNYVRVLGTRTQLGAVFCYSAVMAQYAPSDLPMVVDLVDVDSEKWFQYAAMRPFGWPYAWEGRRLRQVETDLARHAERVLLTTKSEEQLFLSIAPGARTLAIENGVDLGFFRPDADTPIPDTPPFLLFVGTMDYFPNADAVSWFAERVLPALRRKRQNLEFWIVGRDPGKPVLQLAAKIEGVKVTGGVGDIRPYLQSALAFVAPLRLARGIQNKVLEALATGKTVFASTAVCKTFGGTPPTGVFHCETEEDFVKAILEHAAAPLDAAVVRSEACRRFSWPRNMDLLSREVKAVTAAQKLS